MWSLKICKVLNSKQPFPCLICFSWQCQHCQWANGKLSMEPNARWSPDTPLSSSCSPMQLQKVRDLGRGERIMIIQSRGGGRVGIQRSRSSSGGSVLGTLCHNCPQAGKPFFAQISSLKPHSSTWNGRRVILCVDWGELDWKVTEIDLFNVHGQVRTFNHIVM